MNNPSNEYVEMICALYGSSYDDRIENTAPPTAGNDSRIPGEDWMPGVTAEHKSLSAFQRELEAQGIKLSTSKIKKILITGGLWTTETTRMIQEFFKQYTEEEQRSEADAIKRIAEELDISTVSVSVSLPYSSVVYNLPEPSANAKRCRRWKERRASQPHINCAGADDADDSVDVTQDESAAKDADERMEETQAVAIAALQTSMDTDWSVCLWRCVIAFEGETFTTSGRGSRPGVEFKYTVSRSGGAGGRHYSGESVDGYGNELWITTQLPDEQDKQLKKSISRSTVDLAYKRAIEMGGEVTGPKKLNIPGAGSYLYPMLIRFGVIKQGEV